MLRLLEKLTWPAELKLAGICVIVIYIFKNKGIRPKIQPQLFDPEGLSGTI